MRVESVLPPVEVIDGGAVEVTDIEIVEMRFDVKWDRPFDESDLGGFPGARKAHAERDVQLEIPSWVPSSVACRRPRSVRWTGSSGSPFTRRRDVPWRRSSQRSAG